MSDDKTEVPLGDSGLWIDVDTYDIKIGPSVLDVDDDDDSSDEDHGTSRKDS